MGFYATNGRAVKSLGVDDVFGPGFESSLINQYDLSPRAYYTIVPFIRRAVRLRANAVAGVPLTLQRGTRDISARPEFAALMGGIKDLIWRTEFALCLSTYGAYWRRSTNATGLNPTPEWLLPHACWPFITAESGFEYIRYVRPWGVPGAGHVEQLPLEDMVYFWYPSLDRINWPGSPPGTTALAAANALTNRDTFVASYFKRGAIKGVLLQVPQATSTENRNMLRDWWRQVVAGIANAWRSNVISADVKPIIIGDSLKETESDSLTLQYRQDVAAAFDVPESMLLSNSANYATAREERIGFYEETVFPETDLILGNINRQWLRDAYDAELVAHPEQTEAQQDQQVMQAQAITDLVGRPIMTVDEGRAFLGMDPMPVEEEPAAPNEDAEYQAMDQQEQADEAGQDQQEQASAKALAGLNARSGERASLITAHRSMRQQTRERHKAERQLARDRQIEERRSATDAGMRLRLVHRHKAELSTLTSRQAAERSMLWTVQGSERARLYDRHTAVRNMEARASQNGHRVEELV